MQRLIVYCLVLVAMSSCHSSRYANKAEVAESASASFSRDEVSEESSKTSYHWLSLCLDSLDVWIYNQPLLASDVRQDSNILATTQIGSDMDIRHSSAIHIRAKSAHLGQVGMSQSRHSVDSAACKVDTAHSIRSDVAVSESEATAIAKPIGCQSLLKFIAVTIIAFVVIFVIRVCLRRGLRD